MTIKPIRNTFFSIILSSMFLVSPLQIVNASRLDNVCVNLPGEKTTSVGKKGTLKRSKAMQFEKTQLSVETSISESIDDITPKIKSIDDAIFKIKSIDDAILEIKSIDDAILKVKSKYSNSDAKLDMSEMICDFKNMSFALDSIWVIYLICSNSNPIKSDRNIKLIDNEMCSNITGIMDTNEEIDMYINEGVNKYGKIFNAVKITLNYISLLMSWFKYLNSMKIILNESLIESLSEIKYESFGTYCV